MAIVVGVSGFGAVVDADVNGSLKFEANTEASSFFVIIMTESITNKLEYKRIFYLNIKKCKEKVSAH